MTSLPETETDEAGARISQSLTVLMAYAGIRHMKDLAPRVSMSQQTLSRRMLTQQGWMFHEVVGVALYFGVTLDEMFNGLPTLAEWTERRLRATQGREEWASGGSNPEPAVSQHSVRDLGVLRLAWSVKADLTPKLPSVPPRTRHLMAVS